MLRVTERPQWIPVGEMVPSGSIGAMLISRIPTLGERLRPETIFEKTFFPTSPLNESSYGDILRMPYERLITFTPRFGLQDKLNRYLTNCLFLPHGRLLEHVLGVQPFIILQDREQEVAQGVEAVLDKLRLRASQVLDLRFGLSYGFPLTLMGTSKQFESGNLSRSRIGALEREGLWFLWRRTDLLKKYLKWGTPFLENVWYQALKSQNSGE